MGGELWSRHAHGVESASDDLQNTRISECWRQVHGCQESNEAVGEGPSNHVKSLGCNEEIVNRLGAQESVTDGPDGYVFHRSLAYVAHGPGELPVISAEQACRPRVVGALRL